MTDFKKFFKGKKITVMGLGILGRGVGDTAYLAECLSAGRHGGADLIVTDLKTKKQLTASVKTLSKYKNIKFVLGEHRLEDFKNRDMILKSAGVPLNSIYIREARKNKIPVEMSASLFAKLAGIKIIGITGTRGKSTVTHLIAQILKLAGKKVLLGGNVRGVSTLQLLKKVTPGAIAIFELDSWQLQGFGDAKLSPNVAVFTTFLDDHLNYYKGRRELYFTDKANIFKYQKPGDVFVTGEGVAKKLPADVLSRTLIARAHDLPRGWRLKIPGEHNRLNVMCTMLAARGMGIDEKIIRKAVENFRGIEGRLQFVREVKGIKIYNDNNATTPEATIAGIEALKNGKKNIILICGGADKKLNLNSFVKVVNKYCKAVIMIPGTGTDKMSSLKLKVKSYKVKNLNEAVKKAIKQSKKGDTILFSPAFASFGMFNNEYERNDLFVKIISALGGSASGGKN